MPHPERLTTAQLGVTTAPNRSHGPRRPDPMPRAAPTGDVLLDRCRRLAETANLMGEYRIGAEWHDLADRIAAGQEPARKEADRRLTALGEQRELHPETLRKIELDHPRN